MDNDLIRRDVLKEEVSKLILNWNDKTEYGQARISSYEFVLELIDNAPRVITNAVYEAMCTITDQEFEYSDDFWIITPKGQKIYFEKKRPEGEWIKYGVGSFKCSVCGREICTSISEKGPSKDYPYCHCGAKMRDAKGRKK